MRCRFDRVIFQGQNGYCVYAYKTEDSGVPPEVAVRNGKTRQVRFTAVGYNLVASNAVDVDLDGNWENTKYGYRLNVSTCKEVMPTDSAGIISYLSSGCIKGVGPETAKAIVARFGPRTLEVLDNDPQQLLAIRGIAAAKLQKIVKSYEQTRVMRDLMLYLTPLGVSAKKANMIYGEFGEDSLAVVKRDPFQLCEIKGFGFMTVDAIARKTKVSLRHPLRYAGAIAYVLDEARISGHLFLPINETVDRCHDLLNAECEEEIVSKEEIKQALARERSESRVYVEGTRVYLAFERLCEVKVAKRVVNMLLHEASDVPYGIDRAITMAEKRVQQTLSESQRHAATLCLGKPISIITGGPGSGKTTTLKVILKAYALLHPGFEILLAAPTGRASRRMEEQAGMSASTLHSALGLITDEDSDLNDKELLSADLVVVDEFSMVDMRLAYALFTRLKPGVQLIMVGDPDQLPSVGAGNVLREFIRSGLIPVAMLDTVFRQAANSRIISNAYAVNHNDTHLRYGDDFRQYEAHDSEAAAQLVIKSYLDEISHYGIEGVQILTPLRKKGATSSNLLNERIRELVNPADKLRPELKCNGRVFRVGDRVIQTTNKSYASNGDIGVITGFIKQDDVAEVTIKFLDGREELYTMDAMDDLEFSYALTIHKSQGAEWPVVIIPLLKEHFIMLKRNLLYTAITRARKQVILVGQKQAVYMAIHRCDVGQRNTVLADRIVAYYDREQKKQIS